VQYRYDALGRRTHKVLHRHGQPEANAEIITFHWQGLQMVGEQSSRTPDRSVQYLYSEGSWEPVARVDIAGDSQQTFWYHTDLNGLPERMTDERGEIVWQGRFSSWGETEHETHASHLAVPQNLRFQGQYLDRETGLHYNLFRYYDPVAGRFTQPDPIGLAGGLNTYAYVPEPLGWVDPLGLKCWAAKNVNGRKVYQRNNLFDPHRVDADGLTNIQRMKLGNAPIGNDGLEINLHHLTQDEPGSMVEILSSYHSKNDRILHMYSNQWDKTWVGPDGTRFRYNSAPPSMNRGPFNTWKSKYWKIRALDF
jgi:RHS repeat-associated protein